KKGAWLGLPSKKKDGEWVNLVEPATEKFREDLTKAAIQAYLDEGGDESELE
ncbi:MAG: hypothetical protein JKX97_03760, partial [Candidatus Lindowbacteria bacterium]|nr:hypothetical protein [Candidatus Lindowbacteria bacterium]